MKIPAEYMKYFNSKGMLRTRADTGEALKPIITSFMAQVLIAEGYSLHDKQIQAITAKYIDSSTNRMENVIENVLMEFTSKALVKAEKQT